MQPKQQQDDQLTLIAGLAREIRDLRRVVEELRSDVKGSGVTPVKWLSSGEAEVYLKGAGFIKLTREHLKDMCLSGELVEGTEFRITPGGHYRFEVIGIAAKLRQGVA